MLPRAAITGSTCQLIASFLLHWLSGNLLAKGTSCVHFADIGKDAGPLHLWVVAFNSVNASLFHCLKKKPPSLPSYQRERVKHIALPRKVCNQGHWIPLRDTQPLLPSILQHQGLQRDCVSHSTSLKTDAVGCMWHISRDPTPFKNC